MRVMDTLSTYWQHMCYWKAWNVRSPRPASLSLILNSWHPKLLKNIQTSQVQEHFLDPGLPCVSWGGSDYVLDLRAAPTLSQKSSRGQLSLGSWTFPMPRLSRIALGPSLGPGAVTCPIQRIRQGVAMSWTWSCPMPHPGIQLRVRHGEATGTATCHTPHIFNLRHSRYSTLFVNLAINAMSARVL